MSLNFKDSTGGYGYVDENGSVHKIDEKFLTGLSTTIFKLPEYEWSAIGSKNYNYYDKILTLTDINNNPVSFETIKNECPNVMINCNNTAGEPFGGVDAALSFDGYGDAYNQFCIRFAIPQTESFLCIYDEGYENSVRVMVKSTKYSPSQKYIDVPQTVCEDALAHGWNYEVTVAQDINSFKDVINPIYTKAYAYLAYMEGEGDTQRPKLTKAYLVFVDDADKADFKFGFNFITTRHDDATGKDYEDYVWMTAVPDGGNTHYKFRGQSVEV